MEIDKEILEWQTWYNNYRKVYDPTFTHKKLRKYLSENPAPEVMGGKGIDTFNNVLPQYPSSTNSNIKANQTKANRSKVISYLRFALLINNHELLLSNGHPYADEENKLVYSEMSNKEVEEATKKNAALYNVYYWSSENKIRQGKLELFSYNNKKINSHKPRNATLSITHPDNPIVFNNAEYIESGGVIYIRLQRKSKKGDLILSQIILRSKESTGDLYFATYCTYSPDHDQPYSGLMILEKQSENNKSEFRSFYESLLYKKRIQPEPAAISFSQLDAISNHSHPLIKRWEAISKIAGIYLGYLIVPFQPQASLETCIVQVEKNGRVKLWTSMRRNLPFTGILRLGYQGSYESKAIIKIERIPPFGTEHRINIYLNTLGYNNEVRMQGEKCSDSNTAKGIFTCLKYNTGQPFSSQFALCKIDELPDELFKKTLGKKYDEQIISKSFVSQIDEATCILKDVGLLDFFENKSKSGFNFGSYIQ